MKSDLSLNKWRIISWLHVRLVITVNIWRGNKHACKAYQDETLTLSLHVLKQFVLKMSISMLLAKVNKKLRRWSKYTISRVFRNKRKYKPVFA